MAVRHFWGSVRKFVVCLLPILDWGVLISMRAPLEVNKARSRAAEVGSRAKGLGGGIATYAVQLSPWVGTLQASSGVLDSSFQPPGFSVHRSDRVKERTGKSKGGGECFLINELWCTDCVIVNKTCNVNLECLILKCRPFFLPWEFSVMFLCGVYTHPRADISVALSELSDIVYKLFFVKISRDFYWCFWRLLWCLETRKHESLCS